MSGQELPPDNPSTTNVSSIGESPAPSGARAAFAGWVERAKRSAFAKNAVYLTGITGIERAAGLVQTVLIARALGIAEYGAYGLLFGTIGFVASIMGLQMGLTATVFIARHRTRDKAKVGAIIRYVMRFAAITSGLFLIVALPFTKPLSHWLLDSETYAFALMMGCLFVAGSLMSGVQDGIAEGFEDFRSVAIARLVATALTLAAIYPAAVYHGLDGVLLTLLGGIVVKYAVVAVVIARHRRLNQIPRHGGDVSFFRLVKDFSLPSMLVSLLLGAVTWFGMYWLSRRPAGFAAVAVVNVGLQWRGPILLVTNALGQVAVPVFSRHEGANDTAGAERFKRMLMRLNGIAVFGVVAILAACAQPILSLYGSEFHTGRVEFAILVATTIPQVLAGVHMQHLVGGGKMWRQLWLYVPMLTSALIGFLLLVPMLDGLGYALALLATTCVFWFSATIADVLQRNAVERLRERSNGLALSPSVAEVAQQGRSALMKKIKKWIKDRTMYRGRAETDEVRRQLDVSRRVGWPYCSPDEGDLLYQLAQATTRKDALEIGFATGSTAAYILAGLGDGKLISVDYDQDHYERQGEQLIARMGLAQRHTLIEADSVCALPDLYKTGKRFGLVFIDGWKTFDRIWVDTFYCAQMLSNDGYIVFDDARMPAIRKCISLLIGYYGFKRLDIYDHVGGFRQRIWHLLSTRSTLAPYVALQKIKNIGETEAGKTFDFWKPF